MALHDRHQSTQHRAPRLALALVCLVAGPMALAELSLPLEGKWLFTDSDDPEFKNRDLKEVGWRSVQVPKPLQEQGYRRGDGWYRVHIAIPQSWQDHNLLLNLGYIANADEAYFNNRLIGVTSAAGWDSARLLRQYLVPHCVVLPGEDNVLAVRARGWNGLYQGPVRLTGASARDIRRGVADLVRREVRFEVTPQSLLYGSAKRVSFRIAMETPVPHPFEDAFSFSLASVTIDATGERTSFASEVALKPERPVEQVGTIPLGTEIVTSRAGFELSFEGAVCHSRLFRLVDVTRESLRWLTFDQTHGLRNQTDERVVLYRRGPISEGRPEETSRVGKQPVRILCIVSRAAWPGDVLPQGRESLFWRQLERLLREKYEKHTVDMLSLEVDGSVLAALASLDTALASIVPHIAILAPGGGLGRFVRNAQEYRSAIESVIAQIRLRPGPPCVMVVAPPAEPSRLALMEQIGEELDVQVIDTRDELADDVDEYYSFGLPNERAHAWLARELGKKVRRAKIASRLPDSADGLAWFTRTKWLAGKLPDEHAKTTGRYVWDTKALGNRARAAPWNWTTWQGRKAHTEVVRPSRDERLHYFHGARPVRLDATAQLAQWVCLDPEDRPEEIMLSLLVQGGEDPDAAWKYRSFWGNDVIPDGRSEDTRVLFTAHRYRGPLPPAGRWVTLRVPMKGLVERHTFLSGLAFHSVGGRAYWGETELLEARRSEPPAP